MRAFKSLLSVLILFAVIGGIAYGGYYFFIKDDVKDATPEQIACRTEHDMVSDAVKQANKLHDTTPGLGVDPSQYIHIAEAQKYYTWNAVQPGGSFAVQPIGQPPC